MTPTYTTDRLDLRLGDCMELMKGFEDGHFDLAIVDPPYGIGMGGGLQTSPIGMAAQKGGGKMAVARVRYAKKEWDTEAPPMEYFAELRRVSKDQIVWGANHFIDRLPIPSSAWIVWDKVNQGTNQSDAELAWTSFKTAVRKFDFMWSGMLQGSTANGRVMEGNKAKNEKRIHPTQKPVALYRWLMDNYAKPGQRILDTHLGSGSIAIACHYFGARLTATEIDPDYFAAAVERIQRETRQVELPLAAAPRIDQRPLL